MACQVTVPTAGIGTGEARVRLPPSPLPAATQDPTCRMDDEGNLRVGRIGRAAGAGGGGVDYSILGSFEVLVDGQDLDLGPPKQRALLAVLLLNANQTIATERLVELVWGHQPPRTAAHSVQIYVSELRKRFEAAGVSEVISTRRPGYVLHAEAESIDAVRFERLLAGAEDHVRAGEPADAATTLRTALQLWRGEPLADLAYHEFAQPEIRRLDELRCRAVEGLAEVELVLGQPAEALTQLAALLDHHPLREHARELQLLALYRCGRQAEALRAYEGFRLLLADELGLDPSPGLQQLQGRILLQDASLTPVIAAPAGDAPLRNPFKGLRAFTEADEADFHGREDLVEDLCATLRGGAPLIALVGPSGCGKSSVAAAGLIPALRAGAVEGSDRWRITSMVPGVDPARELRAALAATADRSSGEVAAADTAPHRDPPRPPAPTVLLLVDHLEELFTLADERLAEEFLLELTQALQDGAGRVRAVVLLRADFYDQPLLLPDFAALFTANVVSVLPLGAPELEAAVSGPARRVGVDVEPALLAELVADAVGRPGALPLFQYTLTELFDQREGGTISLAAYRRLGGLHGALSRRAEAIFAALTSDQQHIAEQVFLRLVTPGDGTRDVRRRATASELTALHLDPVDTADVLDRFGRHRLLTFDRDPASGEATVEVAHEALLEAWSRMRSWIDDHRADLRQLEKLTAAVTEWVASGREDGELLTGSRLDRYDAWSERTTLRLTTDARSYLDTSRERRRTEQEVDAARRADEARLRARARSRLWALFVAVLLLTAVTTALVLSTRDDPPPDVALVFDTDLGVIVRMIEAGADRAVEALGIDVRFLTPMNDATLGGAARDGVPLIVFNAGAISEDHPTAHPDRHFVLLDYAGEHEPRDNLTYVNFAEHEGSFLVGAAAALTSESGRLGFIGGVDDPLIWRFHAGFEAGARHVDPDIELDSRYLTSSPDFSGFGSPTLGARAATELYDAGADVVYAAAGTSGFGLLETVVTESERRGRHLWAIGVDADEYLNDGPRAVLNGPRLWELGPEDWKPHLLTSMVKRFDVAVHDIILAFRRGDLAPGDLVFDLADGGVDYATSGGFIDHLVPRLDELRADIVEGRIEVPTVPDERR
jgi:basic membrane lipoprotein Med (substrate-binding protein (PBP1-ABC) superfamily)/DNA-binding SARP family transcriptional activator